MRKKLLLPVFCLIILDCAPSNGLRDEVDRLRADMATLIQHNSKRIEQLAIRQPVPKALLHLRSGDNTVLYQKGIRAKNGITQVPIEPSLRASLYHHDTTLRLWFENPFPDPDYLVIAYCYAADSSLENPIAWGGATVLNKQTDHLDVKLWRHAGNKFASAQQVGVCVLMVY